MRLDHRMIQNKGMGNKRMRKARIIDAIGGGLCPKHGEYLGHGQHGLRACPFCDIEEFYSKEKKIKELPPEPPNSHK